MVSWLKLTFLSLFILIVCVPATAADWIEKREIEQLFNDAGVKGTFVLYDVQEDTFTGFDEQRAQTRYIPASTYKIANSLIGITVGAVKDVDEILPYGGGEQYIKAWENDMSLRAAIKISNVPIYQELARRIGLERMQENVTKLGYGNADIGKVVDRFWLDGPLEISAVEQVLFISKLARTKLDYPTENQQAVAEILEIEKTDDWTLHAKTGWETATDPGIGWWVGWVKRGSRIYCFALNIDMNEVGQANKRIDLGKASLRLLGII